MSLALGIVEGWGQCWGCSRQALWTHHHDTGVLTCTRGALMHFPDSLSAVQERNTQQLTVAVRIGRVCEKTRAGPAHMCALTCSYLRLPVQHGPARMTSWLLRKLTDRLLVCRCVQNGDLSQGRDVGVRPGGQKND